MNKEEWINKIKDVYDDLSKEQFELLLNNTYKQILRDRNGTPDEDQKSFRDLVLSVYNTVSDTRRMSFNQFKALSAYSKTIWVEEPTEEYKQF
jgi:hypothetical protein